MGRRARANRHPAWAQTARGLDHSTAKNECRRIWSQSLLTPGARQFAQAFITIQALRHEADYYDYSRYTRSEVIRWIDEAQQAVCHPERSKPCRNKEGLGHNGHAPPPEQLKPLQHPFRQKHQPRRWNDTFPTQTSADTFLLTNAEVCRNAPCDVLSQGGGISQSAQGIVPRAPLCQSRSILRPSVDCCCPAILSP